MDAQTKSSVEVLRKALPNILQSLELTDASANIWGVPLNGDSEALDVVLAKFCVAREHDSAQAEEMLTSCLKWRKEQDIDKLLTEKLASQFEGHDEILGKDHLGRPVLCSRFDQMDLDKVFGNENDFIRYRVKHFEEAIRTMDFKYSSCTQMAQIHDYGNMGLNPGGNVKQSVAALSKVFTDNYPELKGCTIFVNFHPMYVTMWSVFSSFIPEKTRRKFVILGSGYTLQMFDHIPAQLVPHAYGGLRETSGPFASKRDLEAIAASIPAWKSDERDVCAVAAGQTVHFQFRAMNKDLYISLVVVPMNGSKDAGKTVFDRQLITCGDGVKAGSAKSELDGTLQIILDNSHSYVLSKDVIFRGFCE